MQAVARTQSSQILSKRLRGGVPVSRRALEQRVDRSLATQGKRLRRTRGEIALRHLGAAYYVVSNDDSAVAPIDLEALGHELGVLADHERLYID
jgi:hypothetical protein